MIRPLAAALTGLALLIAVAMLTSETRTGVDYVLTTRRIPLYQKAIAYLDRDVQMQALAAQAAGGGTPEERALRLLDWVHAHVRPIPAGYPIVDDHPYATLVRGYGANDQAADALANLAAYAGLPSRFAFSLGPDGRARYGFALVEIDGAWRVFGAREGRTFRDEAGRLTSVEALRADRSLSAALAGPREAAGASYPELFAGLDLGRTAASRSRCRCRDSSAGSARSCPSSGP